MLVVTGQGLSLQPGDLTRYNRPLKHVSVRELVLGIELALAKRHGDSNVVRSPSSP